MKKPPDPPTCSHLQQAETRTSGVQPSGPGCEECLRDGGVWVHLRLCLRCGHVGCCDSSPGQHASEHFKSTKHPVIRSFEPQEGWGYCFVDEEFAETIRSHPGESPRKHLAPPGA
jgi:uncharacterized UBP type Zn finger protein